MLESKTRERASCKMAFEMKDRLQALKHGVGVSFVQCTLDSEVDQDGGVTLLMIYTHTGGSSTVMSYKKRLI